MAHFVRVLTHAIQTELQIPERDARIAASLLISIHRQVFHAARKQALAGKHGATAIKQLHADLERAYEILEHGLGGLEASSTVGAAAPGLAS